MEEEFSMDELHAAIQDLPSEKTPGPDGFIRVFFKSAWNVIRQDLLAVATYFYHQPQACKHNTYCFGLKEGRCGISVRLQANQSHP
jgi:hypothetical protein